MSTATTIDTQIIKDRVTYIKYAVYITGGLLAVHIILNEMIGESFWHKLLFYTPYGFILYPIIILYYGIMKPPVWYTYMPFVVKDDVKYPENSGYSKYSVGITTQSKINEHVKPEMIQPNKQWKSVLQIISSIYLFVWILAINSHWITNYLLDPSPV
jgi:hypothetical protein